MLLFLNNFVLLQISLPMNVTEEHLEEEEKESGEEGG